MLKFLKSILGSASRETRPVEQGRIASPLPIAIEVPGEIAFHLEPHVRRTSDFPHFHWEAIYQWIETLPGDKQAEAWAMCEEAWLVYMQDSLGGAYFLSQANDAILLSSLNQGMAQSALDFMNRTENRIVRVLDGVARIPEWGKNILVVFDDIEAYYCYVSHFYPEAGEFAMSSGMYINAGCGHFVTVKSDLRAIEPVVVHEMVHGLVGHLPLPAWLNEGLAVNTENRLSPTVKPLFSPQEMHAKHMGFWGVEEIHEFWSGKSFLRPDDGNMLSYDLARIFVEQLSVDWPRFSAFVSEATLDDAGRAAASKHLNLDLGMAVCALLEREPDAAWHPDPEKWEEKPERGAF